jgi:uncharacterized tellurite resistance protein B-like protein
VSEETPSKDEEKGMALFKLKNMLTKKPEAVLESQEKDETERLQVATCIILLEVAKSDDEFSSIEKATLKAILKKKFEISAEVVEELMEIASKKREESIDLWQFTNLINQNYTKEEKIKIVESAWRVIYADEKLNGYEDHFVHKLAKLLQLDHSELIETKLKIKYENKP